MSAQWGEAARRGQLALTVMTPARSRAEGWTLREGFGLFAYIEPDGGEPLRIQFKDAARIAAWCEEMRPHTLEVAGMEGEDVWALRDAIEALRREGMQVS